MNFPHVAIKCSGRVAKFLTLHAREIWKNLSLSLKSWHIWSQYTFLQTPCTSHFQRVVLTVLHTSYCPTCTLVNGRRKPMEAGLKNSLRQLNETKTSWYCWTTFSKGPFTVPSNISIFQFYKSCINSFLLLVDKLLFNLKKDGHTLKLHNVKHMFSTKSVKHWKH